MNDAASFDAILQCNLLEVFCEALGAAIFVTDKLDEVSFASIRLLHLFPIRESAISPGGRARDLYGALYDAGCRFGGGERAQPVKEDWIAERIACAWKERVDKIEQISPDRWIRIVSRRFSSGLGFVVIQDVSEQKKKEELLRTEQERLKLTEDILDTLPVAVAVKDRNLSYVAVNQEFCRLLGITRETILGHGSFEALEPELAGRIEQLDWQLLSSGEASHSRMMHTRRDGSAIPLERRAHRLGKPGGHYIVVSLSELAEGWSNGVSEPADDHGHAATLPQDITPSPSMPMRNVIHLTETARPSQALKLALRAHGVDLCTIRDVPEFAAFLPALKAAGLTLDLLLIDYDFDPVAFNIAAASGTDFRMLPDGAEESAIMAEILHKLARGEHRAAMAAAEDVGQAQAEEIVLAPPGADRRAEDRLSEDRLDILAIEDNPVNRLVLEQMLGGLPYTFQIAGSAAEGLAASRAREPRLVLSDTTLPDLDASDLVLGLRKLDLARPVIAIVQADSDEMRRQAEISGFDRALSKPLSAEILAETLRDVLTERPAKASTSNTSAN